MCCQSAAVLRALTLSISCPHAAPRAACHGMPHATHARTHARTHAQVTDGNRAVVGRAAAAAMRLRASNDRVHLAVGTLSGSLGFIFSSLELAKKPAGDRKSEMQYTKVERLATKLPPTTLQGLRPCSAPHSSKLRCWDIPSLMPAMICQVP